MHTLTRTAMVVALVLPVFSGLIQAQQQMRIPDEIRYMQVEKNVVEREVTRPPLKARSSSAPKVTAGQVLIGKMWNAYSSLNRSSNQISYDPYSNTLAVIYRRAYPDRQNVRSGELTMNISTDGGTTWNGESPTINVGTENPSMSLAARFPNILLTNPTESNDRSQIGVAAIWAQLVPSTISGSRWGEVPFAGGILGGSYTKGKLGPNPPDYGPPVTPVMNPETDELFSVVEFIDPTNESELGEYYLISSTDQGKSWRVRSSQPIIQEPLTGNLRALNLKLDISPDGQTLVVGFTGDPAEKGRFYPVSRDLRFGYVKSTDGGATWLSPVMFRNSDLVPVDVSAFAPHLTVRLNPSDAFLYSSHDIAIDAKNEIHLLVTVSNDFYYPLDSTYVGEVTQVGNQWHFFALDTINNPYVRRWVSQGLPGQPQSVFHIFNEHEFAKSKDGNKLYAKWIDPDSNRVLNPRGGLVPDTTHNIRMIAKDARSNTASRGWSYPAVRVTDTRTIDEKFTKMARTVDDNGKINIIYTVFGEGDAGPDTDDLAEANMYFVSGVSINVAVSTGKENLPSEFALDQNYPNPFNPGTQINFSLSSSANARLRVFNLLGQEVATLVDRFMEAGQHTVNFNGAHLPSGIYTYRLESGGNVATQKMLLLK